MRRWQALPIPMRRKLVHLRNEEGLSFSKIAMQEGLSPSVVHQAITGKRRQRRNRTLRKSGAPVWAVTKWDLITLAEAAGYSRDQIAQNWESIMDDFQRGMSDLEWDAVLLESLRETIGAPR